MYIDFEMFAPHLSVYTLDKEAPPVRGAHGYNTHSREFSVDYWPIDACTPEVCQMTATWRLSLGKHAPSNVRQLFKEMIPESMWT